MIQKEEDSGYPTVHFLERNFVSFVVEKKKLITKILTQYGVSLQIKGRFSPVELQEIVLNAKEKCLKQLNELGLWQYYHLLLINKF